MSFTINEHERLADQYHVNLIAVRESDGCRSEMSVSYSYHIPFAEYISNHAVPRFLEEANRKKLWINVMGPTLADLLTQGRIFDISEFVQTKLLKKTSRISKIQDHPLVRYFFSSKMTSFINRELESHELQMTWEGRDKYHLMHYRHTDLRELGDDKSKLQDVANKVCLALEKFDHFLNSPELETSFDSWASNQPNRIQSAPSRHKKLG